MRNSPIFLAALMLSSLVAGPAIADEEAPPPKKRPKVVSSAPT